MIGLPRHLKFNRVGTSRNKLTELLQRTTWVGFLRWIVTHVQPSINNRTIAGTPTKIAGKMIDELLTAWVSDPGGIQGIKRHHKPGCAKAALRPMMINHGLLNRMQTAVMARKSFHCPI